MAAIVFSILAGLTIVLNRMINAELAKKIGIFQGTLFNYITGLITSFAFLMLSSEYLQVSAFQFAGLPIWAYAGGFVGVAVIALSNYVAPRISAFYLTLIVFVAQLFTGSLIDFLMMDMFSIGKIIGGLLVLAGLAQNLLVSRKEKEQEEVVK